MRSGILQYLLILHLIVMNYSIRAFHLSIRSRTNWVNGRKWMFPNSIITKSFSVSKEFHNVQQFTEKQNDHFMRIAQDYESATDSQEEKRANLTTQEGKLAFVKEIFENFYNKKKFLLPKSIVSDLLDISTASFQSLPNVISVRRQEEKNRLGDVFVFGDLHGQFYDFYNIVKKHINKDSADDNKENVDSNEVQMEKFFSSQNTFIFNGDIADRGPMGSEIFITLLLLKLVAPNSVFILRGNHETDTMTMYYGFQKEVRAKYGADIHNKFLKLFQSFPIACVVEDQVFITHGGLGKTSHEFTLEEINRLYRFQEPEHGGETVTIRNKEYDVGEIIGELLWSDPRDGISGFRFNTGRGGGIYFGADITEKFLTTNGLQMLVRSHECVSAGIEALHGGRTITLFSAPNYCGVEKNMGAILRFPGGDLPEGTNSTAALESLPLKGEIIQYAAVKHPVSKL